MSTSTTKEIANLEAEVRGHLLAYHDLHAPTISDSAFDKLFERLQELAPHSPALSERSQYDGDFKHSVPMGSLTKVKTAEDLYRKFAGKTVTISPKIDGAGMMNRYHQHRIAVAATRGKSETQKGKNVTVIVPAIPSIPNYVQVDEDFEARGEAVILKNDWEKLVVSQPELSNARNAASGGINSRNIDDVRNRKLTFIAYKKVTKNPTGTHADTLEFLKSCGFVIPTYEVITLSSVDVVREAINRWALIRKDLPYETDGIVVRVNSEKEFSDAGMTSNCWNGGLAFKYENESAETVINDIVWTTSRIGFVTPVAWFNPVQLGGAGIEKCTLNNPTWMQTHGNPAIGSRVVVSKMNDIIPNITDVLSPGSGTTKQPTHCPSCGSKLDFAETNDGEGAKLKCPNDTCGAKLIKNVRNMLEIFEVKGMDEVTIAKIDDAGLLPEVWSIFDVSKGDLVKAGFGNRESEKIVESLIGIEAKPETLVASCGIEGWGRRMLSLLQTNSSSFTDDRLLAGDFPYDELTTVHGVGPAKASLLSEAFSVNGKGKKMLEELLKRVKVVKKTGDTTNSVGGKLAGKTFLITGTLSKSRKFIEADIVSAGGSIASGVSKNLSYLVVGEDPGSKVDKANKLGVPTIDEAELYSMI